MLQSRCGPGLLLLSELFARWPAQVLVHYPSPPRPACPTARAGRDGHNRSAELGISALLQPRCQRLPRAVAGGASGSVGAHRRRTVCTAALPNQGGCYRACSQIALLLACLMLVHDVCMQMVTGLLGATAYQFRIRAENRMGKSAWSMPSRLVSTCTVPDDMIDDLMMFECSSYI